MDGGNNSNSAASGGGYSKFTSPRDQSAAPTSPNNNLTLTAEYLLKSVFTAFDFLLESGGGSGNKDDQDSEGGDDDEEDGLDILSGDSSSFVAPSEIVFDNDEEESEWSIISDSSDEYSTDSEDDRTLSSDGSDSSTEAPSVYKYYDEEYLKECFDFKEENVLRIPSYQIISNHNDGVDPPPPTRNSGGRGRKQLKHHKQQQETRRRATMPQQPAIRSRSMHPTNRILEKKRKEKRKIRRKNRQQNKEGHDPVVEYRSSQPQQLRYRSPSRNLSQRDQKKEKTRSKPRPERGTSRDGRDIQRHRSKSRARHHAETQENDRGRLNTREANRLDSLPRGRSKSQRHQYSNKEETESSSANNKYAEMVQRAARSKSRTKLHGRTTNKVLRELQDVPSPTKQDVKSKLSTHGSNRYTSRATPQKKSMTQSFVDNQNPTSPDMMPQRITKKKQYGDQRRRPPTAPKSHNKHKTNIHLVKTRKNSSNSRRQHGHAASGHRNSSSAGGDSQHEYGSNASSILAVGSTESKKKLFRFLRRGGSQSHSFSNN